MLPEDDIDICSKIIIVGDGAVGKTCVISCMTNNTIDWERDPDYEPTVFNNYMTNWDHPSIPAGNRSMEIWDTAGQESFQQLRCMSYPDTKVFFMAYDVSNRASLSNVYTKWEPEIAGYGPDPDPNPWVILIGTKADFRNDKERKDDCIPLEECEAVAKKIGASMWIETSAKTNATFPKQSGIAKLQDALMCLAYHRAKGHPRPNYDDQSWFKPGLSASDEPSAAEKMAEEKKESKVVAPPPAKVAAPAKVVEAPDKKAEAEPRVDLNKIRADPPQTDTNIGNKSGGEDPRGLCNCWCF